MSSDANDLALICRIPGRQLQNFSRATDDGLIYVIALINLPRIDHLIYTIIYN